MEPRVPRQRRPRRARRRATTLAEERRARLELERLAARSAISYGSRPARVDDGAHPAALRDDELVAGAPAASPVLARAPPAAARRATRAASASAAGSSPAARALVDARVHVRQAVVACSVARLPRLRDGGDLVVGQLRERAHVPRRVHDDLLPLERGVEVRHDAHRPLRRVADAKRLGRRAILAPCAERALVELGLASPPRSAPHAAPGRRRRFGATTTSRPESGSARSSPARSRNGLIRSIGAGKMIVDVLPAPSSSSVCR